MAHLDDQTSNIERVARTFLALTDLDFPTDPMIELVTTAFAANINPGKAATADALLAMADTWEKTQAELQALRAAKAQEHDKEEEERVQPQAKQEEEEKLAEAMKAMSVASKAHKPAYKDSDTEHVRLKLLYQYDDVGRPLNENAGDAEDKKADTVRVAYDMDSDHQ